MTSDRGTRAAARLSCIVLDLATNVTRTWRLLCDTPSWLPLQIRIPSKLNLEMPAQAAPHGRGRIRRGFHLAGKKNGRRRRVSAPSPEVIRPRVTRPSPRDRR
jgi:hypothetical protein